MENSPLSNLSTQRASSAQLTDLSALLSRLSEDPSMMNTLAQLLLSSGARNTAPPPTEHRAEKTPDTDALAGMLKLLLGNAESPAQQPKEAAPSHTSYDSPLAELLATLSPQLRNDGIASSLPPPSDAEGAARASTYHYDGAPSSEAAPPRDDPRDNAHPHANEAPHGREHRRGDGKGYGDSPLRRLLGGKVESENRIRLLNALKPYLGEERRGTIDTLLKLLKIAELGEFSGLFSML